jgi:BASS family bile acid:Na+ symporter
MLVPLAIGLLVKARLSVAAAKTQPLLNKLSTLSLALLITLLLITNMQNVLSLFGTRGIFASILFIAVGGGLGWILGGPGSDTKNVLSLGTAQRNIAASLVVGGQNFNDPRVVVMVVVVALVGLLILIFFARFLAKPSALVDEAATAASSHGAGRSL